MKHFFLSISALLALTACTHHGVTPHQKQDNRRYIVVDARVSDPEKYDQFIALEQPILKNFGAHLEMEIRSDDQKQRHLIIVFPDEDTVKKFVSSPAFQEILPLGKASAESKIFHGTRIR